MRINDSDIELTHLIYYLNLAIKKYQTNCIEVYDEMLDQTILQVLVYIIPMF